MMKKSMTRAMALLAAGTMALSGLAACGNSANDAGGESKGKVFFLNFKSEIADEWQALIDTYVEQTGVDVSIQTAASGTYESVLKSEMAKSEAPTLFQVNGPVGLATWKDYAADLSDTDLYAQLTDQDLALKSEDGSKVLAVPYAMETYGLIYNKDIFGKYTELPGAKYTSIDEIKSFADLKAVAEDLEAHKDELGILAAFTSAGFDSSSDWRYKTHLANIPLYYEFKDDGITQQPSEIKGTYLPQFKEIFDLYVNHGVTPKEQLSGKTIDDINSEFSMNEAVFYQNGTWVWADLKDAGMDPASVGMIPIYIGAPGEENQGLSTGTENYWCINAKASEADQKATADFLKWVITSEEGVEALSQEMGMVTPFKAFSDVTSDNPLVEAANADTKSGTEAVTWNFTLMPSETWKNGVGNAMLEYAQGTGEWSAVETAFVDGWASEYANAHAEA